MPEAASDWSYDIDFEEWSDLANYGNMPGIFAGGISGGTFITNICGNVTPTPVDPDILNKLREAAPVVHGQVVDQNGDKAVVDEGKLFIMVDEAKLSVEDIRKLQESKKRTEDMFRIGEEESI